jgi:CheY-like chemotaxis protein
MYSQNLAIIVVDDQESGRNFARAALSREGYSAA